MGYGVRRLALDEALHQQLGLLRRVAGQPVQRVVQYGPAGRGQPARRPPGQPRAGAAQFPQRGRHRLVGVVGDEGLMDAFGETSVGWCHGGCADSAKR
jgi:hypothetical protein